MIVRHIEMTRRRLPQRADSKDHPILLPSFLIDFQRRDAGGCARQPRLQAAGRLLAAEAVRNRNDKRCGHLQTLELSQPHVIPHSSKRRGMPLNAARKWNLMGSDLFFQPKAEQWVPTAGVEGMLDGNPNYYPDYSCYRFARWLQRRRRRAGVRHRILWRRPRVPAHAR